MTMHDTIIYCGMPLRRDHVAAISHDAQRFALEATAINLAPLSADAFMKGVARLLRGGEARA